VYEVLEEQEEDEGRWKYDSKGNVVLGGSNIRILEVT